LWSLVVGVVVAEEVQPITQAVVAARQVVLELELDYQ
jgi:hypothetical protein